MIRQSLIFRTSLYWLPKVLAFLALFGCLSATAQVPSTQDDPFANTQLPLDLGPLPMGLANWSAQGCNACHYEAHQAWESSAHAKGWESPSYRSVVESVGLPACSQCHLPLKQQSPLQYQTSPTGATAGPAIANPSYDPIIHSEGVTCVACHVRNGHILGSRANQQAPHPVLQAPGLTQATFCAACHQLTTPGANQPLYDTFGEWQRSPQAKLNIQCQDCHMRQMVNQEAHRFDVNLKRAVSALLDLTHSIIVRGGTPVSATLTLQNTGAAHHFPTGSPFKEIQIRMSLAYLGRGDKWRTFGDPFQAKLGRELQDSPPWNTLSDNRLAAGTSRSWTWPLSMPVSAPTGPWKLVVSMSEHVRGSKADDTLIWEKSFPLVVR